MLVFQLQLFGQKSPFNETFNCIFINKWKLIKFRILLFWVWAEQLVHDSICELFAIVFSWNFQKSMCSEMASELRYALDCGNGNKKPSRKALCRRQGQHSSLSIVSEEGKYATCNKYRHFVGKAPLTWTKGCLVEWKEPSDEFLYEVNCFLTGELKHTWSVNSKHGRNGLENEITAKITKIISNCETTFKCKK